MRVHVCASCRVFTVTPSWQGKIDGPCYRFLADKSPYNHLISYYQQPQTLKLIFIGVKKKKSPMASSTFMVLTFHWWFFFLLWVLCVSPMQVETPGGTPTRLMESNFWSSHCSKHVQGDSPRVVLRWEGNRIFFPPWPRTFCWVASRRWPQVALKPVLKCLKPAFLLVTRRRRLHWLQKVCLYESQYESEPASHLIYFLSKRLKIKNKIYNKILNDTKSHKLRESIK